MLSVERNPENPIRSKSFVSILGYALTYVTQHPQCRQTNTWNRSALSFHRPFGSSAVRLPLLAVCYIPEYRFLNSMTARVPLKETSQLISPTQSWWGSHTKTKPRKQFQYFRGFNYREPTIFSYLSKSFTITGTYCFHRVQN